MDIIILKQILENVATGKTSAEDAAATLMNLSIEDIDYAHIDHQRSRRKGFPEVIFGQGKTPVQIIGIMEKMLAQENVVHRLFNHKKIIDRASVLIVVAGMEGALPSVVAGMVSRPVIAVPTSVGYGVSLGGLTALFAMLNSCSSNVAVVNIDNGFGAGYLASVINRG